MDLALALVDDAAVADMAVAETARTLDPWRQPPPRTHDTSSAPTEPPTQNVTTHLPRTATDSQQADRAGPQQFADPTPCSRPPGSCTSGNSGHQPGQVFTCRVMDPKDRHRDRQR